MTVQKSRNVRPRSADYDEEIELEESGSEVATEHMRDSEHDSEDTGEEDDASGAEDGMEEEDPEQRVKTISFGALKQAQDALPRKRKRGSETTAEQDQKLEALRARLRKLREAKIGTDPTNSGDAFSHGEDSGRRKQTEESSDEEQNASDSDSGPSEEDTGKSRSSKHAPAAMSSKRQVTRRRTVVDVPKRVVRDPRFDAINQGSAHPGNSDKAYSFLRDYQKSEIQELKAAMKKAKSSEDKETLKRTIGSMENRIKAKEAKEREQDIIRQHRKEERGQVQQGKTPYYLKKKDIKEKALIEKFKGMKGKDREKLIEKRKKKEGQKEKKRMPEARRLAG